MFLLDVILFFLNPLISLGWILLWYQLVAFVSATLVRIALRAKAELNNDHAKIKPSRDLAVLITGATSGIGLAIAKYFHGKKFTVIVGYYNDQEPGFQELKKLGAKDNSIHLVQINVRSIESIVKSHAEVKEIFENNKLRLHALVNNAGIAPNHPIIYERLETLKAVIETNLLGPIYMIRQYTPLLAQTPGSRVVNVSSLLAHFPNSHSSVYGATKIGLKYLTDAIHEDLAPHKIHSVVVLPGNLLKNTGIMSNPCKDLDLVYESMTEEEKAIFSKQFEKNKEYLMGFHSAIKKHQGGGKSTQQVGLRKKLNKMILLATGSIKNGIALEHSSLMDSFDNAVCLKNPHKEFYGGNKLYSLVVSSLIDSAGTGGFNGFYKMIIKYLSKTTEKTSSK